MIKNDMVTQTLPSVCDVLRLAETSLYLSTVKTIFLMFAKCSSCYRCDVKQKKVHNES